MKQVAQDIHEMTGDQLDAYIKSYLERGSKRELVELCIGLTQLVASRDTKMGIARQLEAGYWTKKMEPKRPPEDDRLGWYVARKKELERQEKFHQYKVEEFIADGMRGQGKGYEYYQRELPAMVGDTHD